MADKKYDNIVIEREGGITFLMLNRPDKRNAMSPGLHFDMDDALTQLCACYFAVASEDATFGLSEVNWGIIPGGIGSWNLADMMLPRHALYYAVTGDTFDGKRAVEIGLVNFAVPKAKLREETVKLAEKLMKLNDNVVRYTKEAIRAVRKMDDKQARDYLKSKQDSLKGADKEIREQHGMKQFLDEKSYRPGRGPYRKVENG